MSNISDLLHQHAHAMQARYAAGAFALLDQDGKILDATGIWPRIGAPGVEAGVQVEEALPMLVGMLTQLSAGAELWLPIVEVKPALYVDFAIEAKEDTVVVAAWNASDYGKALQELVQRRNELHASNALLKNMTAELSQSMQELQSIHTFVNHEVRNVAQNVRAAVELLAMTREGNQREYYVRSALAATAHLVEVASTALQKSAASSTMRRYVDVVPRDVISRLVKEFRPLAERMGLELAARFGAGSDRTIRLDVERLQFVVSNLLNNAIKFTPHGFVEVSTEVTSAEASAEPPLDALHIQVRDSGPGLTQQQLGELFEPFKRFESTASALPGSGLGLYICKHLSETMGARLVGSSDGAHGCAFTISVPVEPGGA